MNYAGGPRVCGTNGVTYVNPSSLWCAQKEEYSKLINLQLKHDGACWIWEKHGIETSTVLFVSIDVDLDDSISILILFHFWCRFH